MWDAHKEKLSMLRTGMMTYFSQGIPSACIVASIISNLSPAVKGFSSV